MPAPRGHDRHTRTRARTRLAQSATGALYDAVKQHVRTGIRTGRWVTGGRIPSEHALVATLGVSRMTVNRALREMADSGELVRYAGVGTFVAAAKPQSGLLRVVDIGEEIRSRGHAYECRLVHLARTTPPAHVAVALGIPHDRSVFRSVCVHHENGVPVQLEDRYVNPAVAPGFIAQDFSTIRPSEYLLRVVALDEVEHMVDAVLPDAEDAVLLRVSRKEPCLVLTRRTWLGDQVVTWVRCVHPGTRYRLGARFKARDANRCS